MTAVSKIISDLAVIGNVYTAKLLSQGLSLKFLCSVRLRADHNFPPELWPVTYEKPKFSNRSPEARKAAFHWEVEHYGDLLDFARYRWVSDNLHWPGYAKKREKVLSLLDENRLELAHQYTRERHLRIPQHKQARHIVNSESAPEWTGKRLAKRRAELDADGCSAPIKRLAQETGLHERTIYRRLESYKRTAKRSAAAGLQSVWPAVAVHRMSK